MLRRIGAAVRDGWLVVGLSLGLLLGLEALYRAQASLRFALAGNSFPAARNPATSMSWFGDYKVEERASSLLRWEPYVYWRRPPFHGRYINVDGAGHRLTVQRLAGAAAAQVYLFGGSTMWGTDQRDSFTIPSVLASRLAERGLHDIQVVNFGESGYVFTQEALALELELRHGARPAVVVFYDGINEVAAALQSGRAGIPQNEANRVEEFDLGRSLAPQRSDLAALGRLGLLVARRSHLLERLQRLARPSTLPQVPPPSLADSVVRTYAQTARLVEALAAAYGFRALYIWQPTLQTTKKRLTPFERMLLVQPFWLGVSPFGADERNGAFLAVHRDVAERMSAAMAEVAPGRFLNLTPLFAGDTSTVYMDEIGHTTEAGSVEVADTILPSVLAALGEARRGARVHRGPS